MANKCRPMAKQIQTTDGKRWIAGRMIGREFQVSRTTKYWKTKAPALRHAKKICD